VAEPGTAFERALQEADLAMYGAKKAGRGVLHIHGSTTKL
jgi:GGDEF domain-containing protein